MGQLGKARPGSDLLGLSERSVYPRACWRASAHGCTSGPERQALAIASPGTCHSSATCTGTREKEPGAAASGAGTGVSPRAWGRGRGTGGGAVTRVRHLPVRVRRARGVPWGVGCWPGLVETGLELRGPPLRPPRLLTSSSVISVDLAASFLLCSASPALRFFLWREMPPSDTGEGREREMRVMSLRMLGEISGAAVQWKASWGAEEEITRGCSS